MLRGGMWVRGKGDGRGEESRGEGEGELRGAEKEARGGGGGKGGEGYLPEGRVGPGCWPDWILSMSRSLVR